MVNKGQKNAGWTFKRGVKRSSVPKKFGASYVRTPRIDANVAAAYNAMRSAATVGSRGNTEHKLDNSFTKELPRTIGVKRSERGVVINKLHEEIWAVEGKNIFELYTMWTGEQRYQGIIKLQQYTLKKLDNGYRLFMYWTANEYLFVQEYEGQRFISKPYSGRDRAMQAYKDKRIAWNTRQPIS